MNLYESLCAANPMRTVVVRRELAAEITSRDPIVSATIKRMVSAAGREWLAERRVWLIHGSRVDRLLADFKIAGLPFQVDDRRDGGGRR